MSILKFEKFVKSKKVAMFFWAVAICAMSGLIIRSIIRVKSGHGLDYYITGKGYQFNSIGALTSTGAILLALFVGWCISKYKKTKKKKNLKSEKYKSYSKRKKK